MNKMRELLICFLKGVPFVCMGIVECDFHSRIVPHYHAVP
jgi:hypothetical protein